MSPTVSPSIEAIVPLVQPAATIAPLQTVGPTLQTVIFWVLAAIVVTLGVLVTAIAYRGYRRNQSRPMLFIAIGFGLVVFPQIAVGLLSAVIEISEFTMQTVTQLSNVVGLSCILYAITMDG